MKQYLDYLRDVLANGSAKEDRTGTGTRSVFGRQMRFDLSMGFPLVTTKKLHVRSILHELLWFLGGETNVRYLNENGVTIWDEWADERGELGPIYGKQWRRWEGSDGKQFDQMKAVVDEIRRNPDSRRLIVSAWNVDDLPHMALPPCHMMFQFYVAADRLSLMMYQRSVDSFLGLPFNIASYAILAHMVAQQCDLIPGELVWTGGDCHLYDNHVEQAELQVSRTPLPLPRLVIHRKPATLFDYRFEDFEIVGYRSHPHIKAAVAV